MATGLALCTVSTPGILVAQEGYEEAFANVRDFVGFEVYNGCLKGPDGTRIDGAGNSLDRALLLAQMLKTRGYAPRIAYGRLGTDALRLVTARALGFLPYPTEGDQSATLTYNPVLRTEFEEMLKNHYWVQLEVEDGWLDLDPTLTSSEPGQALVHTRKYYEELPSFLYQKLEISIHCEFQIGDNYARSRLLRFGSPVKDLLREPLVMLFLNQDSDGYHRYSSENRFSPVIFAVGKMHKALNLKAEAARLAGISGGPMHKVTAHRLWMELVLKTPGRQDQTAYRLLHSKKTEEYSRLDEIIVFTLTTGITPYSQRVVLAEKLRTAAEQVSSLKKPKYPWQLSATESLNATTALEAQRDLCIAIGSMMQNRIRDASRWLDSRLNNTTVVPSPHVLSVAVNPNNGILKTDILLLNPMPWSHDPYQDLLATAGHFLFGIAASAQEGSLLRNLNISSRHYRTSRGTTSAVEQTRQLHKSRINWLSVSTANESDLYKLDLPSEVERHMAHALAEGKILILPIITGRRGRSGGLVWWELDPGTGAVLGMIMPGLGGAQQQLSKDWSELAAAYAPGFTDGWYGKLAYLCRQVSGLLLGEGDEITAGERKLIVETASIVRQIIADALANRPDMPLDAKVRRFFSTEGAWRLNSLLDAGRAGLGEQTTDREGIAGRAARNQPRDIYQKKAGENTAPDKETIAEPGQKKTEKTEMLSSWPINLRTHQDAQNFFGRNLLPDAAERWRSLPTSKKAYTLSVEVDCSEEIVRETYTALKGLQAPVFVIKEVVGERSCYRICVGMFNNRAHAYAWIERVNKKLPSAYPVPFQIVQP